MARFGLIIVAASLLVSTTAFGADQLLLGKKLLIKNPPSGAAGNKVVHLAKDVSIAIGTAGSSGDPQCTGAGGGGGSLQIVASGIAGDVTIPLPCGGWTTNGANTLYKYKDPTGATCKLVLVKAGVLAKAVCKGSHVTIDVDASMSPVAVVTTLNTEVYCSEFGGTVAKDGSDDKTFLRKESAAPAACPAPPDTQKLVFVTNQTYDGNLGGLAGADAECNAHAAVAGLPGTYRAWLSDSVASPSTRFTHATVPYVRVDDVVVANNWTDLTDGTLAAAIDVNESGGPPPDFYVWTNTKADGTANSASTSCGEWLDGTSASNGLAGETAAYNTSAWTSSFNDACDTDFQALYCFQQ